MCSELRHFMGTLVSSTWKVYVIIQKERGFFLLTSYNFCISSQILNLKKIIFEVCKSKPMRKFQSQYNRHKLLWAWKCPEQGTLGSSVQHTPRALALSTLSSQEIVCQLDHFKILLTTFHQSSRLCKVDNITRFSSKPWKLKL